MEYIQREDLLILLNLKSFNIKETLECGQCFRFNQIDENFYTIIANERVLHIKQDKTSVELFPCTINDFKDLWEKYFDLQRNYCQIKEIISKDDKILQEAIDFAPGIRLLNQDPYECLISFIISQNNRIPMIKQVINNLCETFGKRINGSYKSEFYSFPTYDSLNNATLDEIMACKTGFRAKYIKDACSKIVSGELSFDYLSKTDEETAREHLTTIYGVGQKVADCVLLLSLERYSAFPTDVWVKRVMEEFYFNGKKTPIRQIHLFAYKKWGEYSGFAQQYLFNYAKEKKIGKN